MYQWEKKHSGFGNAKDRFSGDGKMTRTLTASFILHPSSHAYDPVQLGPVLPHKGQPRTEELLARAAEMPHHAGGTRI